MSLYFDEEGNPHLDFGPDPIERLHSIETLRSNIYGATATTGILNSSFEPDDLNKASISLPNGDTPDNDTVIPEEISSQSHGLYVVKTKNLPTRKHTFICL